jgi:uncharacterized protein (DUF849 family)
MHMHLRRQEPDQGHIPSWDVNLSKEVQQAIREACPGVIINHTTGVAARTIRVRWTACARPHPKWLPAMQAR